MTAQHKKFKAITPRMNNVARSAARRDITGITILDRTPCRTCATRADIGCEHQPPSQPEALV